MNKITNLFRRHADVNTSDNAVDLKKNVIDVLISRFKQLRFDDSALRIPKVVIWVSEPEHIVLLKNKAFVDQVHTEIENNFIITLKDAEIIVKMGKPAEKLQAGCIVENAIWFTFDVPQENEVSSKKSARITIAGNRGSLKKKVYELDTDVRTLFHIGRGDVEVNRTRPYRENHIVIDDTVKDKTLKELNQHVSGSHADIIFDDGVFYIKATPYGFRPDGSKTSVIRENANGSEEHEIRDSHSRFRLKDGDLIELGESVVLQFSLSK